MEFEPKIFRTIVFVRHGQYDSDPEKLTALGRKQAKKTAKALAMLKPVKLHCSTMPRAMETATIIGEQVGLSFKAHDMFREGRLAGTTDYNEIFTKDMTAAERKTHRQKVKQARENANLAFKKLFKPPQKGQSTEIVVAHGNVIRHWVCKALEIPEERWMKMDVSHTSITTIRVSKAGKLILLGFADTGHLPLSMRTYV